MVVLPKAWVPASVFAVCCVRPPSLARVPSLGGGNGRRCVCLNRLCFFCPRHTPPCFLRHGQRHLRTRGAIATRGTPRCSSRRCCCRTDAWQSLTDAWPRSRRPQRGPRASEHASAQPLRGWRGSTLRDSPSHYTCTVIQLTKARPTSSHATNVVQRPACPASPPHMLPQGLSVRRLFTGSNGTRASLMALFAKTSRAFCRWTNMQQ